MVGPHARGVLARDETVGERRSRRDVPASTREARQVRAVGAGTVVDAVEVHRVRPVVQGVQVLEVHEEGVAHLRTEQRALDAPVALLVRDHARPVLGEPAVHDGAERRLVGMERLALDRVALVGDDVPGHGHGRHPVLAHLAARAAGRREQREREQGDAARCEGRERERPRPSQPDARHETAARLVTA